MVAYDTRQLSFGRRMAMGHAHQCPPLWDARRRRVSAQTHSSNGLKVPDSRIVREGHGLPKDHRLPWENYQLKRERKQLHMVG
jgi:hypothetical protein